MNRKVRTQKPHKVYEIVKADNSLMFKHRTGCQSQNSVGYINTFKSKTLCIYQILTKIKTINLKKKKGNYLIFFNTGDFYIQIKKTHHNS